MSQHTGVYYKGRRDEDNQPVVTKHVDDLEPVPLPPRLDLRRHSPAGLNWGYLGSGAQQLALALTADVLGDEHGLAVAQRFKLSVTSYLPKAGFFITAEAIQTWADELERTNVLPKLPWPGVETLDGELVVPPRGMIDDPPGEDG